MPFIRFIVTCSHTPGENGLASAARNAVPLTWSAICQRRFDLGHFLQLSSDEPQMTLLYIDTSQVNKPNSLKRVYMKMSNVWIAGKFEVKRCSSKKIFSILDLAKQCGLPGIDCYLRSECRFLFRMLGPRERMLQPIFQQFFSKVDKEGL